MEVFSFSPKEYFGSNTFLCRCGSEGVIIDPAVDYKTVYGSLKDKSLKIKYVILTHAHFDHMLYVNDWAQKTECEIIVGKNDSFSLVNSDYNLYKPFLGRDDGYFGPYKAVCDGDVIEFGNSRLKVIETPGHTEGSISLLGDGCIFVGDTVFSATSVGRTDFPGGDYFKLQSSIRKILSLDESLILYPGHGEPTTVRSIKN